MKHKVLFLASMAIFGATALKAQLNVGATTAPDASAVLQATSTTKGFLPPVMTTIQRGSISSPATGLVIINSSLSEMEVNVGTPVAPVWVSAGSATPSGTLYTNDGTLSSVRTVTQGTNNLTFNSTSGNLVFKPTTGGMGIGTNTPNSNVILDVVNPKSSQWISSSFSSLYGNSGTLVTSPSKVVLGYLNNRATIGAHNNALTTWDTLGINPTGLGAIGLGTFNPKAFVDVNGNMRIGTTASGLSTDSILTINATTGLVNRQTIAAITTGSGAAFIANNGLNMTTANTTQLGGALITPTLISGITSTNTMGYTGTGPLQITNTTPASASGVQNLRLSALATSSSIGSGAMISFDNTVTELGRFRLIQEGSGAHGLAFSTYNGSLVEAMRITATGNVGIGVTAPNASVMTDVINTRPNQWVAGSFSSLYSQGGTLNSSPSRVVLGTVGGRATLGANNYLLNTWDTLAIHPTGAGAIGFGTYNPKAFVDINGNMRIGTTAVGASTDAILTQNSTTGMVNALTSAQVAINSGAATIANNGLNMTTANTSQLGGALITPTNISGVTTTNTLTVSGTAPALFTNSSTWIGSSATSTMGGATPDKVVMGNYLNEATIGAHNNALSAWSNINIQGNRIDITSNAAGTSGMRFTNLNNSSTPVTSGTAPLLINSTGDVVVGVSGSSSVLTLGDVLTTSPTVASGATTWDIMRVNITVAGTYLINYSTRAYNGSLSAPGGCTAFLHTAVAGGLISNTQVMIRAGNTADYVDNTGTGSIIYIATGAVTIHVGVKSVPGSGSPAPPFTILSDGNGNSYLTAVRLN